MPFSRFHAVVFDFLGTLTPAVPSAVRDAHAARTAAPLGIEPGRWRQAWDDSFPERAVGGLGDLRQTVTTLAARCGLDAPPAEALSRAVEARLAGRRELFAPRENAVQVLEWIRQADVRTAVLTECSGELADHWPQSALAPLVDVAVFSCREGRRKPDPELYAAVADRLGIAPERCLYVGAGGSGRLRGAEAAGMTAVLLRTADRAEHRAAGREADWPGRVLTDLHQVAVALDYPVIMEPDWAERFAARPGPPAQQQAQPGPRARRTRWWPWR
ncbi:HAD family hydrolase [Streptomyces sp. TLI_171]|uniref:HAD family hydrolase n=1 Tax=Streptomyces sp. TLI_171 TaxID=1938859 RepID=UPI000C1845D7|nr:HAD family hydrolase [Streptomyces sp. TLI_171]RKE22596.1 putative hydrolase of the HAD superfamily [Streptomyces sp. TLI_171]